jgi:hypothetical protein
MSEELNRAIQIYKEKSFSNIIREFEGYIILAQTENDYTDKARKIRNGDTLGFYTIEMFIKANHGLTHQEGIDKLSKVKWETFECGREGCLGIKPSVPVLVHGSEELYVVSSGNTYAATAKQIVLNHNKALESK